MLQIAILVGSTRRERQTIKVARFVEDRLRATGAANPDFIDLLELNLPIMEERLRFQNAPSAQLQDFGRRIAAADSLVIVSPEYNFGYPGVLKNALDYLLPEYERKPIGIVSVSAGGYGGLNALSQLRQVALGLGAFPIPASLAVSRVHETFDESGSPLDPSYETRVQSFLAELLWFTEAITAHKARSSNSA